MRRIITASIAMLAACAAPAAEPDYHLIAGSVPANRGPDGNSIFLEAPDGLILVDTGRHPDHAGKLLGYALSRKRPIAAIVNTHWHLDHTTGNYDIRQTYRGAQVYATTAVDGALVGFLGRNRAQADRMIADPTTPIERKAEILRGRSVIDNPDRLRPTWPVTQSGPLTIAGRRFDAHVAKFAATEADLWLYDPRTKLAIVGDLVVDIVPFMDTACPDGWRKALDEIAATPFVTLIPGHGEPMNRSQFLAWRSAYNNFVDCGRSLRAKEVCVAGWMRDAAPFIDAEHAEYAGEAAAYYLDTRLRSSPAEQQRYCRPLKAVP